MSEKQLPILMACRLSVKYKENQVRTVPDMSYHFDKRLMRMSWSVVSKAADSSSRVSAELFFNINGKVMTLCNFKRAVSME